MKRFKITERVKKKKKKQQQQHFECLTRVVKNRLFKMQMTVKKFLFLSGKCFGYKSQRKYSELASDFDLIRITLIK